MQHDSKGDARLRSAEQKLHQYTEPTPSMFRATLQPMCGASEPYRPQRQLQQQQQQSVFDLTIDLDRVGQRQNDMQEGLESHHHTASHDHEHSGRQAASWKDRQRQHRYQHGAQVKQYWCFFDVEATGPSLRDHFVPCIGVAIVELCCDRTTGRLLQPKLVQRKKWYMKPPDASRTWDAQTVVKFWQKPAIRHFYEHVRLMLQSDAAVQPSEAMGELVALCRQYSSKLRNSSATLLSDTSGFDFAWLYYYLSHFGPGDTSPSTLFGYYKPVRDITSYFAGVSGSLDSRYPHHKTMESGGISEQEWREFARSVNCPPHNHDPENDAAHVALRSAWIVWRLDALKQQAKEAERERGDWRSRSFGHLPNAFERKTPSPSAATAEFAVTTASVAIKKHERNGGSSPEDSCSDGDSGQSGHVRTNDTVDEKVGADAKVAAKSNKIIALLVRTDLRLSEQKVLSDCAKASVDLLCAPTDDAETNKTMLRCQRTRYRAADAATLLQAEQAAKQAGVNCALHTDRRSGVPTVLALGPTSAARLASIVGNLKMH